jgi:nucleotide-binding universal stress UspA family protein
MFKTIVMPFDGSELAEHALPYAAALAGATHGRLVLTYAPAPWELSIDAPARLHTAAAELREAGIVVTTRVSSIHAGNPGRAILAEVSALNADAIVIGSHAYGTVGRALFGSVADYVVRHATIPVLVCTGQANRQWPADRPRRLLVPLDGSALAEAALEPARQLALAIGASVDLVGVVDLGSAAVSPHSMPLHAFLETLAAETRAELERLAETLREQHVMADVQAPVGTPERAITQLAEQLETDIIVLASHGRGGVARALVGSVAHAIVQRATVPVLLVQPAAVSAERAALDRTAGDEASTQEQVILTLTPAELALVQQGLDLVRRAANGNEQARRDVAQLLARLPAPA